MTKPRIDADGVAEAEAHHVMKCPACDQWFDTLNLSQVIQPVHDGGIEVFDGPKQPHKRRTR